jgi:hypothetical protein
MTGMGVSVVCPIATAYPPLCSGFSGMTEDSGGSEGPKKSWLDVLPGYMGEVTG